MATTTTVLGVSLAKGQHASGALRAYEVAVKVKGTYAAAGRPAFDFLAALQGGAHQGITAVAVKKTVAWQDGDDGSNVYTPANANIVLSGTGNKTNTFQIHSGATNGDTGAEVADATAIDHIFLFLVICTVTGVL